MAICAPSPTAGRTKDAISANIHIGGNRTPIHPSTLIASAQGLRRFLAITPGIAATTKIRNNTPTTKIARIASDTTSRTSISTCPAGFHARFPAGDFAHLAGAVDTADWRAIGSAVPGDIEIRSFARCLQKLRIRQKGEPCNGMERSFRFIPVNAGVFSPEVRVVMFAPIRHSAGIEELHAEIEGAHRAIFLEMPDEFVLQGVGIAFIKRTRWISGHGSC